MKVGRTGDAMRILARVGGRAVAEREIKEIQEAIAEETGSLADLFTPRLRKPLFVALFLAIVSELSGITVVLYYGPRNSGESRVFAGAALGGFVSIGLVNVLFTVVAIWLMDIAGRRPLLFAGNAGAFVALATIGFLFQGGRTDSTLLVGMMCLFVACFAFSMGPIKWVVMSEIFPTRIRGRAMAIATLAVWVTDGIYNQMLHRARQLGRARQLLCFCRSPAAAILLRVESDA